MYPFICLLNKHLLTMLGTTFVRILNNTDPVLVFIEHSLKGETKKWTGSK